MEFILCDMWNIFVKHPLRIIRKPMFSQFCGEEQRQRMVLDIYCACMSKKMINDTLCRTSLYDVARIHLIAPIWASGKILPHFLWAAFSGMTKIDDFRR